MGYFGGTTGRKMFFVCLKRLENGVPLNKSRFYQVAT